MTPRPVPQPSERVRRRLLDLEHRIEATRRRAEVAEATLGRLTGRRWWRLLRAIRAWLPGSSPQEASSSGPLPPVTRSRMRAPVRDFLSALPAEVLLPQEPPVEHAGWFAGPSLDFASIMPWLAADVRAPGLSGPRIGFIGSAALRRELASHAVVVALDGQPCPGRADVDVLLIEPTCDSADEHWRAALAGAEDAREGLLATLDAAHAAGIPTLCWVTEAGEVEPSRWLWQRVDFLFLPQRHAAAPSAHILPGYVSVGAYNPLKAPALAKAAAKGHRQILLDGLSRGIGDPEWRHGALGLADRLLVIESGDTVDPFKLRQYPALASSFLGQLDTLGRGALLRLAGAELYPGAGVGHWPRLLQAAASGAIPLFPQSVSPTLPEGIASGEVPLLDDPVARARAAHANWRAVQSHHTVLPRLRSMLDLAGMASSAPRQPRVACLLVTRRPHLIPSCIERFRNDAYADKELVIVIHRDTADVEALEARLRPGEKIKILRRDESMSLGGCLNAAFAETDAPYWAKWDDDDFYGPAYLSDLMSYRHQADFDIAGKPRAFTWSQADSTLYWDDRWAARSHTWTTSADARNPGIAGATLLGHRRVLEDVPFPEGFAQGTDSEFLRRALARGWSVLSADPFNFVRFRAADPSQHTWRDAQADDFSAARSLGGMEAVRSIAFI